MKIKIERKLIKMATREENLKKINDELEKLDDEQLEQVAGGLGWNILRNKDQIIAENSNQLGYHMPFTK